MFNPHNFALYEIKLKKHNYLTKVEKKETTYKIKIKKHTI